MKIALTGGGTGGHIYPALSVAEAIRDLRPDVELLFVGSQHGPESALAKEHSIPFIGIPSRPMTARLSPATVRALGLLGLGVFRAKRVLDRFAPDVVIGTGGYTSAAVVLAQGLLRRGPVIIQEQNLLPGRTNLLISRFVSRVCAAFDESATYFTSRGACVEVTGVPIRKNILDRPTREEAGRALNLRSDMFTVLVAGGSQGAKRINEIVLKAIPLLADAEIQILHLVGIRNYEEMGAIMDDMPDWYKPVAYIEDMSAPYAAADLVVCRSGASTLAELTACGLPGILIPYPFAHANHQKLNAEAIARHGAALVVDQKDLSGPVLAGMLIELKSDKERLSAMSIASAVLGKPDAARQVARLALELAESSKSRKHGRN